MRAATGELDEALLQYQDCIAVYEAENERFKQAKERRCAAWRALMKAEAVYVRAERHSTPSTLSATGFALSAVH